MILFEIMGKVIIKSAKLDFIIEGKKVTFQTPLQAFELQTKEYYWYRSLRYVRARAQMGMINDFNELIEACDNKIDFIPVRRINYTEGEL